jgi:hypothetical protein
LALSPNHGGALAYLIFTLLSLDRPLENIGYR